MSTFYQDHAVRQRLIEFLGGDSLEHAQAIYLTHMDGCAFERRELRPASELDWFLDRDLDIARSLGDKTSLLLHLDVEHVNFDSPADAYLRTERAFRLQEPVILVIETLLLEWGIQPLHLITGQGHHFVWRVDRGSATARRIEALAPAPELLPSCLARVPPLLQDFASGTLQNGFSGLALVMEYLAHKIKERAAPLCAVPVEITAVQVGPGVHGDREIISVDISEYGDPLHTRMVRMPFTNYLKPLANGLASRPGENHEEICIRAIPLHEMNVQRALIIRQDEEAVKELASRACVRIPEQGTGTERLLDAYMASRLRQFHDFYYAARHDPKESWKETYGRTPLATLPHCVQHIIEHPNDLLLKPVGMQLVTRVLLAEGWHPRHIAGLIRSKFEDPAFGWGVDWQDYDPAIRADFYTRVFAGLYETGLDRLVDFNCVSTAEKGCCYRQPSVCCGLETLRNTLLSRQCT